jgi:glycosyltransferase involved in cell wall biosynthesis
VIALVCRSHPEPTQTFHRRTAAALSRLGAPVLRVALRRAPGAPADDPTTFLRETGASAARAFLRGPLGALASLLGLLLRARRGDKEGGRAGAFLAWLDGLRLADWARRRGDVLRFHAQFASWEASACLVAARATGRPFSFEVHNPYTLVVGRRLLRWKARRAALVTAISEDARARLAALAPEVGPRARVVRCGVDAAEVARLAASVPAEARDVVAVGSLVPRKGHDVLVRAMALLAARRPGTRAAIVGEGPERARLAALVAETGAPVELLGARGEAETLALTAAARVAVLACVVAPDGDEDGVPVALMEAMALGRPVVSTPVGGVAELLGGGRAGALVASGDPVGLAVAVGDLLDDEPRRARLGEAGRARVAALHDLGSCARDLAAALGAPA